jgi:MFS family permease
MKSVTIEVRRASRAYVYVVASIAAVGGFNGGYDLMLMSGAILSMSRSFHIYSMHVVLFSHTVGGAWIEGFTMTSAWYGMLAGMIVSGYLTDRIGRRGTLIFSAVLLTISALGTTMPRTLLIWNISRTVGGVGGGLSSIASTVYISEIAPAEKRGALVTFNILAVVLGALLSNLATYLIARFLGTNPECWRWMFASAALPMMIFLVGLWFIPESLQNLQGGDSITIDAVRGTCDTLTVGNMYQVKATYRLASQEKALLAAFVTTSGPHSSTPTPNLRTQEMIVGKGEGHFTLLFYMWEDGTPAVRMSVLSCSERELLCRRLLWNWQLHLQAFKSSRGNITDRINAHSDVAKLSHPDSAREHSCQNVRNADEDIGVVVVLLPFLYERHLHLTPERCVPVRLTSFV